MATSGSHEAKDLRRLAGDSSLVRWHSWNHRTADQVRNKPHDSIIRASMRLMRPFRVQSFRRSSYPVLPVSEPPISSPQVTTVSDTGLSSLVDSASPTIPTGFVSESPSTTRIVNGMIREMLTSDNADDIPTVRTSMRPVTVHSTPGQSGGIERSRAEICPPARPRTLDPTPTDTRENHVLEGDGDLPPTTQRTRRRNNAVLVGDDCVLPSSELWPHDFSGLLAAFSCMTGMFNMCRFGLVSAQFGGTFLLQFMFLSLVVGFPLMTMFLSIGQHLKSGPINMWKVCPIFKGIGIAVLITQLIMSLYIAVPISWLFVYLRDSFITKWAICSSKYMQRACFSESGPVVNMSLGSSISDYFHTHVLKRSELFSPELPMGGIKFEVAFNLAIVWLIVLVCLCRGSRSLGKVVYVTSALSLLGIIFISIEVIPVAHAKIFFLKKGATFSSVLLNTEQWILAAREVFFVWGLNGGTLILLSSFNKHNHPLRRDTTFLIFSINLVLVLAYLLTGSCFQILASNGHSYVASSFESKESFDFLVDTQALTDPTTPQSMAAIHKSLYAGIQIQPFTLNPRTHSGYMPMRLGTEIFPSFVAVLGSSQMSPFWSMLFYFTLIIFGFGQLITIWFGVVECVIAFYPKKFRNFQMTITALSSLFAYVSSIPFTSEIGIYVFYFFDACIGCAWWLMIVYLLLAFALFFVRGKPFTAEKVATRLFSKDGCFAKFISPFLVFSWNVIVPLSLLVLSIVSFNSGDVHQMFHWSQTYGYVFWPTWVREIGSLLQLFPVSAIPIVGLIQSYRKLSSGPDDIFDRMQSLYRPSLSPVRNVDVEYEVPQEVRPTEPVSEIASDPPPKYTPPPSYSSATGAKLAKMLRQGMRQSMRRLQFAVSRLHSSEDTSANPPDYSTVVLETLRATAANATACGLCIDVDNICYHKTSDGRPTHLIKPVIHSFSRNNSRRSTGDRLRASIRCIRGTLMGENAPSTSRTVAFSDEDNFPELDGSQEELANSENHVEQTLNPAINPSASTILGDENQESKC